MLAGNRLIFRLLSSYSLVLQQVAVDLGKLFHQRSLLVVRLKEPVLMRAELFQFSFKELVFLPGNGLLI